jgi:hypothetical protein
MSLSDLAILMCSCFTGFMRFLSRRIDAWPL